jgi:type VI secretion system protein ImpF
MSEIERSILAYGVPDLTGANLSNARAREEFLRSIESVIRGCEPRFKSVRVAAVENTDPLDRTLRFRIDALLYADPAPEAMVFDSHLEPVTRSFALKS